MYARAKHEKDLWLRIISNAISILSLSAFVYVVLQYNLLQTRCVSKMDQIKFISQIYEINVTSTIGCIMPLVWSYMLSTNSDLC